MRLFPIRAMLIFAVVVLAFSSASFGQVVISVGFAPPALPVYEQPVCPGDGYIWTPGYWAWDDGFDDYYWVPGTWVLGPEVGFLWTPPWWGWADGVFVFHDGFWGPHVGFYGGIDYGFGYFGDGFVGGRWDNGHFFYNRAVMNINVTNIHNVYNETVNTRVVNHVSYNGGTGGIVAHETAEQEAWGRERRIAAPAAQLQHIQAARGNPQFRASANGGKPPVAATARPGEFTGHDVVAAREAGAPYHPPADRAAAAHPNGAAHPGGGDAGHPPAHVKDLPPMEKMPAPNTGDANLDKKYQQQQDKLQQKQEQERQKVQAQQEKEDQRMAKQNDDARKQQTEQRHQQQTQQLQQRHTEQRQALQQREAPAPRPSARPPRP
jgi:WXXGXW repeat (2 copies)